jgi:hypothetical protein
MSPALAGLFFACLPALASSRACPLPQDLRKFQGLHRTCGSGRAREEAGTAQQIRAFSAYLDNLLKFLKFLLASISDCP